MNILIPYSWLTKYLKTTASAKKIAEYLSLSGPSVDTLTKMGNEWVMDIEVTTNRIDMFSVLGIARDARSILKHRKIDAQLIGDIYQKTKPANLKISNRVDYLKTRIDPELCPRFSAVLIEGVSVKQSPPEIRRLLTLAGHRPINNLVDASNWLMHAYGQPVHVFDYDLIEKHQMTLRSSKKGEKITTLDKKTFELPGNDIVIEDGGRRLIDLCGVMGGSNSAVNPETKNVLLFVQNYEENRVRQTSLKLSQRTIASQIFEKDPDPEAVLPVLFKGIELIGKWAGGKANHQVLDIYQNKASYPQIKLEFNKMNTYLNNQVSDQEAKSILSNLGFKVEISKENILATPPSWLANNMKLDVDLIEEIARIWGYQYFESLLPTGEIPQNNPRQGFEIEFGLKQLMKSFGYTELYSDPLISKIEANLVGGCKQHLRLKNPLGEEWEYLRSSLLQTLLKAVSGNEADAPVDLFDLSPVFIPKLKESLPDEIMMLAAATHRSHRKLLGQLNRLMNEMGIEYEVQPTDVDMLANERSGVIVSGKTTLGIIGQIDPRAMAVFGLSRPVWVFELNAEKIKKLSKEIMSLSRPGKYSSIVEDLTLIVGDKVTVGPILKQIQSISGLVVNVLPKKYWENTVTLGMEFNHPSRQLTQAEVNKEKTKITAKLTKLFGTRLKV